MKRFNSALVALSVPMIACTLAVGCGDTGGGSTSAKADTSAASSAKPGPSAKTASSAAPSSTPSSAAKAGGDTAPAPADAGATIKYMPKTCETARVFINAGKLLGNGDLGKNLNDMKGKLLEMGGGKDADKGKKVDEVLTAEGFTMSAVREVSLCMGKEKKGLVAAGFDTSGLKGSLAEVMSKAIAAGTGKEPTKKDEDGVTYLSGEKPDEVIAIKGNVLLAGDSIDALKAAAKASGDGAADYGDATSYVVWVKGEKDGEPFSATVKEAAADYEVKVIMPPPKSQAAEFKADSKKALEKMQGEVTKGAEEMEKQPALKPIEPAVKNLKLAMEGDNIAATTTFPQKALSDLISEVLKDPKMLGGMMH